MRLLGEIERLDAALAAHARGEAGLRLRLGQALEVMSRGAVFELGFSSPGAYAVERCERGGRWAEGACCMARRLEQLPALRQAMSEGRVSWSMAELLARVAQAEDEARWLAQAEGRTVRQVQLLVTEAVGLRANKALRLATGAGSGEGPGLMEDESCSVRTDLCTLSCTIDQEEAWLFEATRSLLELLGTRGSDAQCEALLAEAQGRLLAVPSVASDPAFDLDRLQGGDGARERWLQQLERWRGQAEALCENNGWLRAARAQAAAADLSQGSAALDAALGMASLEHRGAQKLDAYVRALARALARHELDLARLLLEFHRADGWRRLGYASETQYARERLGASRSSVLARRALALRLEKLPAIAAALGAGQIGVEAALQIVRVATANTEAAWLERARKRTIKHLREEVSAALVAVRCSGELDCLPPADAELAAFQALEQAVVSGQLFGERPASVISGSEVAPSRAPTPSFAEPTSEPRRAWLVMLSSLSAWLGGRQADGVQMSVEGVNLAPSRVTSSAGRVTLRLRMSRDTYVWWHWLEALARRWLPRGMSWLRFLCLSLWQAWQHLLGASVAYGHIYIRDRYRCTSPVCNRRDVTPHHIQYRSAGGGDEDDNLTSACTWCHLSGVHGGRIRARGPAGNIHWELGPKSSPCLVVHGRERVAA